jgi:hypothetical protein
MSSTYLCMHELLERCIHALPISPHRFFFCHFGQGITVFLLEIIVLVCGCCIFSQNRVRPLRRFHLLQYAKATIDDIYWNTR